MHLFDPESTFDLVNQLNINRPTHQQATIEIYPTIGRVLLEPIRKGSAALGLQLPMTPNVTVDQIRTWQKKYPLAKVSRVHLPFSYNNAELWHRPFLGEKGLKDRAYQIAWILYFGAATNERGINIAEQLNADGQEVAVNAHANVLEGFARDGRIEELKQRIPIILAENERRYNSPIVKYQRLIWDPNLIREDLVEKYGLSGMLLGVDHGMTEGIDMQDTLKNPKIQQHVRAMHLAQTTKDAQHAVITVGDKKFSRFLEEAAKTPFQHKVRAALDYSPDTVKGLSGAQELELVRRTINWIMSTQSK